jgi:regulator of replication initiation timing
MTHLEDLQRLRNLNYSFAETTALRNRITELTKENIILKSSKQGLCDILEEKRETTFNRLQETETLKNKIQELEAKIEILTQQIQEYDLYE